jgi:hypothetical protein
MNAKRMKGVRIMNITSESLIYRSDLEEIPKNRISLQNHCPITSRCKDTDGFRQKFASYVSLAVKSDCNTFTLRYDYYFLFAACGVGLFLLHQTLL